MDALYFWILAATTVVASVLVVGQRNPMYSVVLLIVSFCALSGLYVLLGAPFVAAIQIIIYAGAIMVLFLFVVMLLNVPREEPGPPGLMGRLSPGTLKIGAVLSLILGAEVIWALSRVGLAWFALDGTAASVSDVTRIGAELFTRHAFAFEATSILILVAMVGAVVIARREH
jgi:NADH-quinone oxidoreductase subunit J